MARQRGLGRGLDALLSGDEPAAAGDRLATLPVTALRPGKYQPRTNMHQEAIQELADSIKSQGMIQPILARELARGEYEIIAGERRWRAAQLAGLREVPVLVREVRDEAALAMALIENIQREDLSAIEEAAGIQRLIDDFGMTHQAAAEAIGRSRSAVTNILRLLSLPKAIQQMILDGALDMGHARALLPLDPSAQLALAHRITAGGLNVGRPSAKRPRLQARPPAPDAPSARIQTFADSRRNCRTGWESGSKSGCDREKAVPFRPTSPHWTNSRRFWADCDKRPQDTASAYRNRAVGAPWTPLARDLAGRRAARALGTLQRSTLTAQASIDILRGFARQRSGAAGNVPRRAPPHSCRTDVAGGFHVGCGARSYATRDKRCRFRPARRRHKRGGHVGVCPRGPHE